MNDTEQFQELASYLGFGQHVTARDILLSDTATVVRLISAFLDPPATAAAPAPGPSFSSSAGDTIAALLDSTAESDMSRQQFAATASRIVAILSGSSGSGDGGNGPDTGDDHVYNLDDYLSDSHLHNALPHSLSSTLHPDGSTEDLLFDEQIHSSVAPSRAAAADSAARLRRIALIPRIRLPIRARRFVTLPNNFIDIIRECANFRCPEAEEGSVPMSEKVGRPGLCVICGAKICMKHARCCSALLAPSGRRRAPSLLGGANLHSLKCSAGVGVFLDMKSSSMLLVYNVPGGVIHRGSFYPSVYVDKFGETDSQFRRGNPLRLSLDRLWRLEKEWLLHRIPNVIVSQSSKQEHNWWAGGPPQFDTW